MRRQFRTILIGVTMAQAATGLARAQGWAGSDDRPAVVWGTPAVAPAAATPVFSSPYGSSQGYGFAPATYWPAAGQKRLSLWSYFDGTISSPYRPGSTYFMPPSGYFATGHGPVVWQEPW